MAKVLQNYRPFFDLLQTFVRKIKVLTLVCENRRILGG
jgi:hypothetical protein